jgi:FHS family glucose/mannose:H+ symporter-like MFS transporter
LVAAQFTALIFAPLAAGWIADRIGKKAMLLFAMPLFSLGCFLTALSPSTTFFIAAIFITGAGYSINECTGTSALSDSFPGKESKYLNMMQCTFCIGAVVSPLFFRWLFSFGKFNWPSVFIVSGCGYVLLYPLMLFAECRKPVSAHNEKAEGGSGEKKTLGPIFRSRFFLILIFCMLAYVAIETESAFFADALFVWGYTNTTLGAYAISGFWLAMGVSRFVFSWIKMEKRTMVLLGFSTVAILLVLLILLRNQWITLFLFMALGALLGPVWPMVMGIGASLYQEKSGTISGVLYAAGGIGGALMPVLIGLAAERAGLYAGFGILAALALAGFGVMFFTPKVSCQNPWADENRDDPRLWDSRRGNGGVWSHLHIYKNCL